MKVRDMTQGPAMRLILSTALPLLLGNMFQQMYTIVDASVVGRGIGLNALAALGSADWFNWLFFSIVIGFAQGFSIPIAQAFGAKEYGELRKNAGNAISLGLLTAAAITIIALLVVTPVLRIMGTPDEVRPIAAAMLIFGSSILSLFIEDSGTNALDIAVEFLTIMACCLPILYVLYVYRSALQGMGNTIMPMVSGIAEFVMRTGAALILPGLIGYSGLFWAEVLAWIGADLILIPSYYDMYKQLSKTVCMND